ncbi:SRPBCC family protein [Chondrinema litorale]|uniref:SRPBCC family protein n=1 Tax=Chondrinema litorale TaxID=2994555 RepID=UPI002542C261|nr:SRPBCC family protein [Chondrinema litorale]UZR95272.1 SRPBCC family protein [Chondrinema litorale]
MYKEHIAEINKIINVPVEVIWDALINPKIIKKYMFGTEITSNWKEGSKIEWVGELDGKPFEENGLILLMIPENMLQYNRYSLSSKPNDTSDNFKTITIELTKELNGILVNVKEDNNQDLEDKGYTEQVWNKILNNLKTLLEEKEKH